MQTRRIARSKWLQRKNSFEPIVRTILRNTNIKWLWQISHPHRPVIITEQKKQAAAAASNRKGRTAAANKSLKFMHANRTCPLFTCWIHNWRHYRFDKETRTHTRKQNDVDITEIDRKCRFNRTFDDTVQCVCWASNTHNNVHNDANSTVQKVNKSLLIAFSQKVWQPWYHIIWGRF